MIVKNFTSPHAQWAVIAGDDHDAALNALADLTGLPRPQDFPRPGQVASWTVEDWLRWGQKYGFVAGATSRHGQVIQHEQWPTLVGSWSSNGGDIRSGMNGAAEFRRSYTNVLSQLLAAARWLAANDRPSPALSDLRDWFIGRTTGTSGRALMTELSRAASSGSPEADRRVSQLLPRLRPKFKSVRALLIAAGLPDGQADSLVLANRGRDSWQCGAAGPRLAMGLQQLQADLADDAEPEVLVVDAAVVAAAVAPAAQPEPAAPVVPVAPVPVAATSAKVADAMAVIVTNVSTSAAEVREALRVRRIKQAQFFRLTQELSDLQCRMHADLERQEKSEGLDVLEQAAAEYAKMYDMYKRATALIDDQKRALDTSTKGLEAMSEKLRVAQLEKEKLEERLTDPNAPVNRVVPELRRLAEVFGDARDVMGMASALLDGRKTLTLLADQLVESQPR